LNKHIRQKYVSETTSSSIAQLLDAWLAAVERYVDLFDDDNCWWYNERANISILAGAAWSLNGWAALEEYPTRKRASKDTIPKHSCIDDPEANRRGRCDLYVTNASEDFAFEAKHVWKLMGSAGDEVAKAMGYAKKDALKLITEADRHFAATFIVPFLPKEQALGLTASELHDRIQNWLDHQNDFGVEARHPSAYACIFPKLGEGLFCNDTHHYPGVVLVLQELGSPG
jgi:hypothetical protein